MPVQLTGYDAEKCARRNLVAALRYGVNTAPISLASKPRSEPVYTEGSLWESDEEALDLINKARPKGQELTLDQVYILPVEAASNRFISDRYMFLGSSTLRNIAADATRGFAFMNSHRTGALSSPAELPFGRTFTGQYQQFAPKRNGFVLDRTVLGFYMVRGVHPNGANGPSTDDMHAGIKAGTIFDASMGINGGVALCDVCENPIRSEDCGHTPGSSQNVSPDQRITQRQRGVTEGRASCTLEDGHGGELSAVYDGAIPGAGFSKAVMLANRHAFSKRELEELRFAYASLLGLGLNDRMLEENMGTLMEELDDELDQVEPSKGFFGPISALFRKNAESTQELQKQVEQQNLRIQAMENERQLLLAQSFTTEALDDKRILPSVAPAVTALLARLQRYATSDEPVVFTNQLGIEVSSSVDSLFKFILTEQPKHGLLEETPVVDLAKDSIVIGPNATEGDTTLAEAREDARRVNKQRGGVKTKDE